MSDQKTAILYSRVLPDHTCPFGVRAKAILEEHSFHVDDQVLGSRREVDDFDSALGVDTTPQVFIAGKRIGGCNAREQYLAR